MFILHGTFHVTMVNNTQFFLESIDQIVVNFFARLVIVLKNIFVVIVLRAVIVVNQEAVHKEILRKIFPIAINRDNDSPMNENSHWQKQYFPLAVVLKLNIVLVVNLFLRQSTIFKLQTIL